MAPSNGDGDAADGKTLNRLIAWFDEHSGAVTAVSTVGILIVTAAYAAISCLSLSAMREQTVRAEHAFLVSERPWVTLGHPPGAAPLVNFNAEPLVRNDATGNLEWQVTFFPTNIGHSPARQVMTHTMFLALDPTDSQAMAKFIRARNDTCDSPSPDPPGGVVIFPSDTRGPESGLMTIPAKMLAGCQLYAMICITYESDVGSTVTHHRTMVGVHLADTRGPITPGTAVVPFANLRTDLPIEFPSSAAD